MSDWPSLSQGGDWPPLGAPTEEEDQALLAAANNYAESLDGHSHDGAGADAVRLSGGSQTGADAAGDKSTSGGEDSAALLEFSTAYGWSARAEAEGGTAVGAAATADGSYAIAVGQAATATGVETVAIGKSVSLANDYATAVGSQADATEDALALGFSARAMSENSVAIGANTSSTASDQTALGTRHVEIAEVSAPANGDADTCRFFARDNGSGKTQFCVIFPSGAVQVLATEP